jgi:hypothetical protein
MAMESVDIYPVISQITAAFAGFGSLASGLGKRRGGDDSRMDAYRLQNMLRVSLSATLFGLLPATFAGFAGETWALQFSALIGFGAHALLTPASVAEARKLRNVAGFSMAASIANFSCSTISIIAFALCALDIPPNYSAGLYLLALMAMLGSSAMLFSRVIVSMLRPLHKSPDDT